MNKKDLLTLVDEAIAAAVFETDNLQTILEIEVELEKMESGISLHTMEPEEQFNFLKGLEIGLRWGR